MTTAGKLLTADDLLAMPDDGKKYELVRGELIEMPPPGFMHGLVVRRIGQGFGIFVDEHSPGFVVTSEVGIYSERDPDTVIAPGLRGYFTGANPYAIPHARLHFRRCARPGGGSDFTRILDGGGGSPGADVAGRRRAAGSGSVHCHGGDSGPFRRRHGASFRHRRHADLRASTARIRLPGCGDFRSTLGNGGAKRIRMRGLWDSTDGGRFVIESAHTVGQRG